jgi:hypothetical protein
VEFSIKWPEVEIGVETAFQETKKGGHEIVITA